MRVNGCVYDSRVINDRRYVFRGTVQTDAEWKIYGRWRLACALRRTRQNRQEADERLVHELCEAIRREEGE